MNYRLVAHGLMFVALAVAVAMLTSLPWAVPQLSHTPRFESGPFFGMLGSALASAAVAAALWLFGRKASGTLYRKEAIAVVGLGWLLASALGALPFLLCGCHVGPEQPMGVVDAFFESASGFSGTGATVITDLETPELVPRCVLFWRSMTHFLGGLGFMVLFVAVLGQGSLGRMLMLTEMSGPTKSVTHSRAQVAALAFASVYLVLNAALVVALLLMGVSLFDALCHAFGTVATGGFSTYNDSVAHFQSPAIEWTIAVFMILACTNFSLLYLTAMRRSLGPMMENVEFRVYLAVLGLGTVAVWLSGILARDFSSWGEGARYSFFQVASIITNTGFATQDFDRWNQFARAVLFLLMFVGGCAGSTSCSIKVIRHILVFKILRLELERKFHPNVIRPLKVGKEVWDDAELPRDILAYFTLVLVVFVLGWLALVLLEPTATWTVQGRSPNDKLIDCASAVAATINGVGPGLGTVGATQNYQDFHTVTKLLLSFFMLLGRLEFFPLLVMFFPRFWTGE